MAITIAIDGGYDSYKVAIRIPETREIRTYKFKSRYELAEDDLTRNNTWFFKLGSKDYLVGEGASIMNLDRDKTSNELHRVCTYAALASESKFIGTPFNLIVTYPMNIYHKGKDSFASYLKPKDDFTEVIFEGETKKFAINDITVVPQGMGSVIYHCSQYEHKTIGMLDIGRLTINGAIFKNVNLQRESMFTKDLGIAILEAKIMNALSNEFIEDVHEYMIDDILENGYYLYGERQEKADIIIADTIRRHVLTIKNEMKANGWDIGNLPIVITGGGSYRLGKYIREVLPQAVPSEDPVYDSVKGSLLMGELIYGEEDI